MRDKLLIAVVALLLVGLGIAGHHAYILRQELKEVERDSRAKEAELEKQLTDLEDRLVRTESALPQSKQRTPIVARLKTEDIPLPGYYQLETEVALVNPKTLQETLKRYTIYHLSFDLSRGDSQYPEVVSFGVARAGLLSRPRFYIDYDQDGYVDLEMMYEFVHYLPLGRMMAKSIDQGISQRIYEAMLSGISESEYLSIDDIKDKGGNIASGLMDMIESHSQEMRDWIKTQKEKPKSETF